MGKYISKRGTTINIPDGIDPKKIAAIKADADSGYGTRAQQTANQLGKKSGNNQTNNSTDTSADLGVNTKTGQIDPSDAFNAAFANWNDSRATGLRDQAVNAAKAYTTQGYEADKAKELENRKQELADRGIPFNATSRDDPNAKDQYGQVIGSIDRKYQGLYDQANNQAIQSGNQIYDTEMSHNEAHMQNFINLIKTASDADLQKYGIDKDTATKIKLGQMSVKPRSGGSSDSSSSGGGFQLV